VRWIDIKYDDNISEAEYMQSTEHWPQEYEPQVPEYWADTRKPTKRLPNGALLYLCARCKEFKAKRDFYADKRVPCGIRNKCKKCYHK